MTVGPFAAGGKAIEMRLVALFTRLSNMLRPVRGHESAPTASVQDPAWSSGADADAELFEALNHVLRLSDLLPAGVSGDRVRRCVCELIEAGTGEDRDARLARLVTSITELQHKESVWRPGEAGVTSAIDRLLNAVRSEVMPILKPGRTSSP